MNTKEHSDTIDDIVMNDIAVPLQEYLLWNPVSYS